MEELRRPFHDELAEIRGLVDEMGAAVVANVRAAGESLLAGVPTAAEVQAADGAVDEAYARLERSIYRIVALQAPVARDLRLVVSCLRVGQELERCGDLACSVARRSGRIDDTVLTHGVRLLIFELAAESVTMLDRAVKAFSVLDADLARTVIEDDDHIDELYTRLLRELFDLRSVGSEALVEMGLVARFLERFGDHAAVIGARVVFVDGSTDYEPNDRDAG